MRRLLHVCVLLFSALVLAGAAHANNRGDVWVDNVGEPSGPGHEMDPHLACANINLWGAGMADSAGAYTIEGWPPSGSQRQAYASTWKYTQGNGGSQVLDVIDVTELVATAVKNGDTRRNAQGFHFKLQFSQAPQKHKTFWVNCPVPSPPPTPPTPPTPPNPPAPPSSPPVTPPQTSGLHSVTVQKSTPTHKKKRKRVKSKRISRRPRTKAGFTG